MMTHRKPAVVNRDLVKMTAGQSILPNSFSNLLLKIRSVWVTEASFRR